MVARAAAALAASSLLGLALFLHAAGGARAQDPEPRWVVGDLHVHCAPPDVKGHSVLTVATAIERARKAGMDFMIITPHTAHEVASLGPDREGPPVLGQQLVRQLAFEALSAKPPPAPDGTEAPPPRPFVVVPGWEHTLTDPGHRGISFVDIAKVRDLPGEEKVDRALELGALVVVNHPYFRPVASDLPLMKRLNVDLRWRPWFEEEPRKPRWNAIEVWHDRSVLVERLHRKRADQFPDTQMVRSALTAWDRATREQRRRITAVGGSDAHGLFPYTISPMPMVSVLVKSFDEPGLHEALLGARVTFGKKGGVAARDFAATSDVEGERAGIGDSLRAKSEVRLTWNGPAVLYENGERIGELESGATRKLDPPGSFAFWRIEKPGDEYSNMIYANLP